MNCWHCKTKVNWHSDEVVEDEELYQMVTFLECPKCRSYYEIYYPKERDDDTESTISTS